MTRRVLVIDGHPDARDGRFVHALAEQYAAGARQAGHVVRMLRVAGIDFPLLTRAEDFRAASAPAAILEAQQALQWAEHIVILYPLWLGSMPSLLKGFFEQLLRPGFAFAEGGGKGLPRKLLKGRSARVVVTMGMPALVYRWFYRAHSLKALERNVLGFIGYGPVDETLIGQVDALGEPGVARWCARLRRLGERGA